MSTGEALPGKGVVRCHTGDLSGRFGFIQGAAGSRFGPLFLKNRSHHKCTLFGYIGGQLYSASGQTMRTSIVRDHGLRPHRVILSPGQSGRSVLHWSAIASGSGRCRQPSYIAVTPPNEYTQLRVTWTSDRICGGGRIDVRPITR